MARLGELSPAASVAIGILVGLLSTSIQSIGLTLQRKSHILEDSLPDDSTHRRPPYRRRRWQIGMLMFVIANLVGSTIQITTLPLPVLSTLQASGLVFNTICATLILSEPFTRWSLGGTCLVAGGAVLIALYGALPEPSHNLDQHLALLARPQFIVWMIGTALIIAIILAIAFLLPRFLRQHAQRQHRDYHLTPRTRLTIGMCFGSVSAILSAHSLLVAKSAVELLVRTIVDRINQFNRWQSWLILLSLICLALSQLYFLHRGLKLCSTSVLYPFVFCIYNIIAILDGLIYFKQTDRLPPLHAGLIAIGTVILLTGVLALSWRLDEENHLRHSYAPTPDAGTLLTPGMGIVEDTLSSSATDSLASSSASSIIDEEAALNDDPENAPLLGQTKRTLTPTTKDNAILRVTKQRRQRYAADADDIWDALMDSDRRSTKRQEGKSNGMKRVSTLTYSKERGWSATWTASSGSDGEAERMRRAKTVSIVTPAESLDGSDRKPKPRRPTRRTSQPEPGNRSTSAPLLSFPHLRPRPSSAGSADHQVPHDISTEADRDAEEDTRDLIASRPSSSQRRHRRRSTALSTHSSRSHRRRRQSRVGSLAEWMRGWWRGEDVSSPAPSPILPPSGLDDEQRALLGGNASESNGENVEQQRHRSESRTRTKGKRPEELDLGK
ncbi:MAG: hypothetical protein M1828_002629 [Chrysothrix sp. TS-e1954]|nr:MAG: hypothetical protein M1828_002629 [Chrysothrix sp. TS-e1954]